MEFSRSRALADRLRALVPGGGHTYAKGADQYPFLSPGVIVRGQGCRVWDADGNEFVEYGMGLRAVGLGHAYPEVVEAVARALPFGTNFNRPSPLELECAEALLAVVPRADMVKFTKDGSSANTAALKLARAHTGRELVAVCAEQPFFSYDDWFIGTTTMDAGIPESARALTLRFPYGDLGALRALFAAHRGRIAAVMMEAARTEEPPPGYLAGVQALCRSEGALFVLDEMITGFRWHLGGAQAAYGLDPDLSTFGKALANGFALSALAGKREVMRLGGRDRADETVFLLSTTHGAEIPSLAAAVATMAVYRREPVIEHLHTQGARLAAGLRAAAARHGLADRVEVVGRACGLLYVARDADGQPSQAFRTLLLQETIARGVLAPSLVIGYAHTPDDVDRTVDAFDGAFAVYGRALSDGVERFLSGPPSRVVFGRR